MASKTLTRIRRSMVSFIRRRAPGVAARIGAQPSQHPPVVAERVIPLRSLDNLNDPHQVGIAHDVAKRSGAYATLGDPFVAVDARPTPGAGVVEMQALK